MNRATLLPRQQQQQPTATAPDLFGSTSPASSTSSSGPASPSSSSSSDGGSNTDNSYVWKYAIIAILAILAVSAIGRLVFVQRLRRRRQLLLFPAIDGRRRQRNSDRRRFSTSTVDLEERGSPDESPAPPAYEENPSTGALPLAPAAPDPRPSTSLFSRISARLHRSSPSSTTTRAPVAPRRSRPLPPDLDLDTDWFGLSMRQSSDVPQSSHALARLRAEQAAERETSAARQTEAIRRALLDAGLLVGPPPRSLSLSMLGSSSREGGAQEVSAREREREERDDRRRRRRERRRREREQRDEGLGLPVYSKTKREGEEVLQVAEGVKEDELSDEDDASASDGEGHEGPPPPAAATAAAAIASTSTIPQTNTLEPTVAVPLPATDRPPPSPPSHPLAPAPSPS
ncbi:hypothetical protein JCM5296_004618 [Sporobolomyces johnsonii]